VTLHRADEGSGGCAEHNRSDSRPVTTDTGVTRIFPDSDSKDRIRLEHAVAAVDEIRAVVRELVVMSALAAEWCPAGWIGRGGY
jgi:hypothetical protein